jgi:hypothetical protein
MPLDHPKLFGTEKTGACSTLYCIYCYKDGAFTHPEMTLEDMEDNVRVQLQDQQVEEATIQSALEGLPFLIRWLCTAPSCLHRVHKKSSPTLTSPAPPHL